MNTHIIHIRHWLVVMVIMTVFGLAGCNTSSSEGDDSPTNAAPVVNAGPDQSIALAGSATLDAIVTDDGLPAGSSLSYAWTQDSGPGTATFADAAAVDTTATFSAAGDYVLRLTANDSDLSGSDTLNVTVSDVANVAPVVDAGPDQSIALAGSATLNATVTDDGLPAGSSLSYAWTQDSGPGTTTFADATAVDTTATFDQIGTYVLRLTASDGDLSGTDTVTVTVSLVTQVSMGVYDATVVEGANNLEFLVVLSEESLETVTVDYNTMDGTALDGEDYQAVSGRLTFAPRETRKTVSVPVLTNANPQATSSKSLHLELTNPSQAILNKDIGIGVIIDKDDMVAATDFDPAWSPQGVFKNADTCSGCHSASPENTSPVVMREPITDPAGEDVSPSTQWDHSVMAHAFDDPYFQAAVQDEASHFPHLAGFIEDTCLNCHSPMARTHAHQAGVDLTQDSTCLDPEGCYRFDTAETQNHAREGVSCTLCHQILDDGTLGTADSFSGAYSISADTTGMKIYGPYSSPAGMNMAGQTGYTPEFGSHTTSSELCATCHTLHTPTLDPENGQPTGHMFLEQGPFFEWQNSVYATGEPQEQQCQGCHMPEPAPSYTTQIATSPPAAPDRTPFATHSIVGANTYLLELLREYRAVLGIDGTTTEAGFDEKIEETRTFLENEAAELSITQASTTTDRLNIDVLVTNKTGHKLPTSYPSRRVWIHLTVSTGGQLVFESGLPDSKGYLSTDAARLEADCMASEKLPGFVNDGCFEPHRNVISDPSEVAIYEAVLGDSNDHITHTLLLGSSYLKDNRLPPEGFTNSSASTIDAQTLPVGVSGDSDFNCVGSTEGCGTDTVHYSIPIDRPNAAYVIEARLLYQAIQPGFVDGLHADGDRVNRFRVMYEEQSPTVETLATASDQVN